MPRVALTEEQRRQNRIDAGNAAYRVAVTTTLSRTRTTQKEVCARAKVNYTQFSRWKNDAGRMSLDQFRAVAAAAGLNDAAILAIVKGGQL